MSINKFIGIGNLTRDPEMRYPQGGNPVTNFSIACNERFKDRDGNQQEKVEFIDIVAWRQLAEICGKYLHKGKQVYIEGKLQTRKWQDKNGMDRYNTEVIASEMKMLGGKSEGQPNNQQPGGQGSYGAPGQQPNNQGSAQQPGPAFSPDDEIPF
jgi:single-strand DNA-binding protein